MLASTCGDAGDPDDAAFVRRFSALLGPDLGVEPPVVNGNRGKDEQDEECGDAERGDIARGDAARGDARRLRSMENERFNFSRSRICSAISLPLGSESEVSPGSLPFGFSP